MKLKNKKEIFSWALYDFANSAFATTVIAGFFPLFFKNFWHTPEEAVFSTARLGLTTSCAAILIAVFSPVFGTIADQKSSKKIFLFLLTLFGVLATFGFSFLGRGQWVLAAFLYVFALMGFYLSHLFYDALLHSVATEKDSHFVSALGYAFGYIGGGLLFAAQIFVVMNPTRFGFENQISAIQFSFFTVALWWFVFSLPLFFCVRETKQPLQKLSPFSELQKTLLIIVKTKPVLFFLIAYFLYIDGVNAVVHMAVDYGLSIGLNAQDLMLALLVTQFVGFPATFGFGFLTNRFGPRVLILFAITVYFGITLWAGFMKSEFEFYMLAVMIGLVQGGIQSLSRSYFANLIPKEKSAEYFGFYNMLSKFAAILGPILIGFTSWFSLSLGIVPELSSRLSIMSVVILFFCGGFFFYKTSSRDITKSAL